MVKTSNNKDTNMNEAEKTKANIMSECIRQFGDIKT